MKRSSRPGPDSEPVHGGLIRLEQVTGPLTFAPSYVDRFVLETEVRASPRQWAIASFEWGVERSSRDLIFQRLVGLDTGPDARPGSVAGWTIASEDDRHVLLAAEGAGSAGNLLVECDGDRVSLTTALAFGSGIRSRFRAAIWSQLARVHRRVAAPTLRTGARLLATDARATGPQRPH